MTFTAMSTGSGDSPRWGHATISTTSSLLPEFVRNTGAVIDIVTKHGTNDFHGDVYWFGRFSALGARDYFNHQTDATGHVVGKDPYTRNTFGFSAGGPLRHDKTFWFGNYDGERFATTLTNTSIVPTQEIGRAHV